MTSHYVENFGQAFFFYYSAELDTTYCTNTHCLCAHTHTITHARSAIAMIHFSYLTTSVYFPSCPMTQHSHGRQSSITCRSANWMPQKKTWCDTVKTRGGKKEVAARPVIPTAVVWLQPRCTAQGETETVAGATVSMQRLHLVEGFQRTWQSPGLAEMRRKCCIPATCYYLFFILIQIVRVSLIFCLFVFIFFCWFTLIQSSSTTFVSTVDLYSLSFLCRLLNLPFFLNTRESKYSCCPNIWKRTTASHMQSTSCQKTRKKHFTTVKNLLAPIQSSWMATSINSAGVMFNKSLATNW